MALIASCSHGVGRCAPPPSLCARVGVAWTGARLALDTATYGVAPNYAIVAPFDGFVNATAMNNGVPLYYCQPHMYLVNSLWPSQLTGACRWRLRDQGDEGLTGRRGSWAACGCMAGRRAAWNRDRGP